MKNKLDEVVEATDKVKEKLDGGEDKEKDKKKLVDEDDFIPELDPPVQEEPFLKAIKALSGKILEGVPLSSGKMDIGLVIEWIKGMENHFECEGITEAQKVKVAKARLRGPTLTWWKFLQEEREKVNTKPITNWKAMVTKIKEHYLP